MKTKAPDLRKSQDPRELPTYTLSEAAHYELIPLANSPFLGSWAKLSSTRGQRFFKPVITLPQKNPAMLSFVNLIEAHVLDAIRRHYKITLPRVRSAVAFLRKEFGSEHPLAEQRIETDGRDLFVRAFNQLIAVSKSGQLAMPELIDAYMQRIEWDQHGFAMRLYPFTRKRELTEPKVIVIDPRVSFGRPVLVGTGIRTIVIAERYKAGESIDELAHDYGRDRLEIEEAIRCELAVEAA